LSEVAVAVAKEEFGAVDRSLLFETEMLRDLCRKHELPIEMYASESGGSKMPPEASSRTFHSRSGDLREADFWKSRVGNFRRRTD
jgi:hypothetical protein